MMSSQNAMEIVARGSGLILNASGYDAAALKDLANRAATGQGLLILRQCAGLAPATVMEIASRGQGRVIFDYTD